MQLEESFDLSLFQEDEDYFCQNFDHDSMESINFPKTECFRKVIRPTPFKEDKECKLYLSPKDFISYVDLRINFFHLSCLNKLVFLFIKKNIHLDILNTLLITRLGVSKLFPLRSAARRRIISDINHISETIDGHILIGRCYIVNISKEALQALQTKIVVEKGFYDIDGTIILDVDSTNESGLELLPVRSEKANQILIDGINNFSFKKIRAKKKSTVDNENFEINYGEIILLSTILVGGDLKREQVNYLNSLKEKVETMSFQEVNERELESKEILEKNLEEAINYEMERDSPIFLKKPCSPYDKTTRDENEKKLSILRGEEQDEPTAALDKLTKTLASLKSDGRPIWKKKDEIRIIEDRIEKEQKVVERTTRILRMFKKMIDTNSVKRVEIAYKLAEANKDKKCFDVLVEGVKSWNDPIFDLSEIILADFDRFTKYFEKTKAKSENKEGGASSSSGDLSTKFKFLSPAVPEKDRIFYLTKEEDKIPILEKYQNDVKMKKESYKSALINNLGDDIKNNLKSLNEKDSNNSKLSIAKKLLQKAEPVIIEREMHREIKKDRLHSKKKIKRSYHMDYKKYNFEDVISKNIYEFLPEVDPVSAFEDSENFDWDEVSEVSSIHSDQSKDENEKDKKVGKPQVIPGKDEYIEAFEIFSCVDNFENIFRNKKSYFENKTIPKGRGRYYVVLVAKLIKLIKEGRYKKNVDKDVHKVPGGSVKFAAGNLYNMIKNQVHKCQKKLGYNEDDVSDSYLYNNFLF